MTKQVTIDLDDEVLVFVDRHSGGNWSEYINQLLRKLGSKLVWKTGYDTTGIE